MQKNFWRKFKKPILALAPMAGITDSAFRQICQKNGADVVYSEMASADALFFKPQKTLELLRFNKKERPYVVQLFGKNPEHFAVATKIVTQKIKPDGIDINFGCPAKKVFGHGSGCALMPQTELTRKIISAVCENTHLPVSIKIRAGLKNLTALDFIKNIQDLPFAAVMVHGRTYEGSFAGPVDFALVQKIKKMLPDKIVLANGGITEAQPAVAVLKKYPEIDGLGIGRGVLGRPWLFAEIKSLSECHLEKISGFKKNFRILQKSEAAKGELKRVHPVKSSQGEVAAGEFDRVKKIILRHAKLIYKDKPEAGIFEMRKHLAWYVKGFPGAAEIRHQLVQTKSLVEIKKILQEI